MTRLGAKTRELVEYLRNYAAMPETRDSQLPRGIAFAKFQEDHLKGIALDISNAYLKERKTGSKFEEKKEKALSALKDLQSYFPENSQAYDSIAKSILVVMGKAKSLETSVA